MSNFIFVCDPAGDHYNQHAHQLDVLTARGDDAAVAAEVQKKVDARHAELEAAEVRLNALCAQAEREAVYAGSSVRLRAEVEALAKRVAQLEGEINYLQTAMLGLSAKRSALTATFAIVPDAGR